MTAVATTPTVLDLLEAAVGGVPGGVARPGQQLMAQAVAAAAASGEHLLIQAGTGTGKSLGYLVPALTAGGTVVVSTATLALQNQLVEQDLPRLSAAVADLLGKPITAAVLKGRHHYLCAAKLAGSAEDEQASLYDDDDGAPKWIGAAGRLAKAAQRLRQWAAQTKTGDRDELDPGVDDLVWRAVSMPARECVGALKCPFGAQCFAEASRQRAREAQIVVTNHSLLAIDMLQGRHIIPPHRLLILDEAHEFADRVSSASQAELTADAVERVSKRVRSLAGADRADLLAEAADRLNRALRGAPEGRLATGLPEALRQALTLVDETVRRCLDAIADTGGDEADPIRRQQSKAVLLEINETAQRLLDRDPHDVIWIEQDERRRAVVVAPLSVAKSLTQHLYDDRVVVATSATLALGADFATIARSLGLPSATATAPGQPATAKPSQAAPSQAAPSQAGTSQAGTSQAAPSQDGGQVAPQQKSRPAKKKSAQSTEDGPAPELAWRSLDVGSPFDYQRQGILYVAKHLPRPAASGLPDAAGQELVRLVNALGGATLGLFSSRRAAEQAAICLRANTDLEILLQGEQTLPLLVKRFRESPESCLLGVMSLWQGVDVPGEACQLVVIDRLPFPRPDEPLAAARSAAIDASGGSGFTAVSVPIAAVRLAQGVGRLIRTATDRGVVAVLDSRLATAPSYGPFLRSSLPPFWYTTDTGVAVGALTRLAAERPKPTTAQRR